MWVATILGLKSLAFTNFLTAKKPIRKLIKMKKQVCVCMNLECTTGAKL